MILTLPVSACSPSPAPSQWSWCTRKKKLLPLLLSPIPVLPMISMDEEDSDGSVAIGDAVLEADEHVNLDISFAEMYAKPGKFKSRSGVV